MNRRESNLLSPTSSFLTGAGSIFNLAGNYYDYDIVADKESNAAALAHDWAMVEEDINEGIAIFEKENELALACRSEAVSAPAISVPPLVEVLEEEPPIVGRSPAILYVRKLIEQIASTNVPVLITGESGTGKKLVARAISQKGDRARGSFVAIDCGGISEEALEIELFGSKRGSMDRASPKRMGHFERCNGGTLFFDHVTNMPKNTQEKVLRVLKEGAFYNPAKDISIPTDVRLITAVATQEQLWQAVKRKEFCEELSYRLNVFNVNLPPLKERSSDIPLLTDYFIHKLRSKCPCGPSRISLEALAALQGYTWTNNVSELERCMEYATFRARGDVIQLDNLPHQIAASYNLGAAASVTPTFSASAIVSEGKSPFAH